MAKKIKKAFNTYSAPERVSFPEEEKKSTWLSFLLDTCLAADTQVRDEIGSELSKKGRSLACTKGCSTCCKTHITIPVYPLELLGIYWYAIDVIVGEKREMIQEQLRSYTHGDGCPFLVEGACGIHPMRPLACRYFNVFGKPCGDGEDPFYSRRKDVLTPDEKQKNKVVSHMLPYHGITGRQEKKEAIKTNYLFQHVRNLQEVDWPKLGERMNAKGQIL